MDKSLDKWQKINTQTSRHEDKPLEQWTNRSTSGKTLRQTTRQVDKPLNNWKTTRQMDKKLDNPLDKWTKP